MYRSVVGYKAFSWSSPCQTLTVVPSVGVAWSMGPEWPDPKTFQHWPGKLGHELRNKVDSAVSYDFHTGSFSTWGFLCDPEDERFECNTFFKLYLDPDHRDNSEDPPSFVEARAWYQDYLRALYHWIIQHFTDSFGRKFSKQHIECVAS